MPRYGPDISHWQTSVDLARAKPHVDFVFLKATEGLAHVDKTFAARWQQLKELGIPRGAYHYAHPNTDADRQAGHFCSVVRKAGWDLGDVPILDMEDERTSRACSPAQLRGWAARWIQEVRRQLAPRGVVYYTYIPYWTSQMGDHHEIPAGAVGWIARYKGGDSPWDRRFPKPRAWPEVPALWQFTDGSHGRVRDVPGLGRVDMNEMTEECFAELFGGPTRGERPVLRRGDSGLAVRSMQQALINKGHDLSQEGGVDGVFGLGTELELVAFQSARGLIPDGVCGPQTWEALLA